MALDEAGDAIATAIPGAERETLVGQGHVADPDAVAARLWGSSVHERSTDPSPWTRDPTTWSARRRLHLPVPDGVRMPIMRRCATSPHAR
jgi:hypothetical protein